MSPCFALGGTRLQKDLGFEQGALVVAGHQPNARGGYAVEERYGQHKYVDSEESQQFAMVRASLR
jgi:hypothetical protein